MTNKQGETDMPSAPDETTISEVLAAEDERIAAIHAGDWDRVGEFLGDDLSYTHMSGKLENKAENMAQNAAVRRSYKHTDILVRPFGDTAVMNSGLEVTVGDPGICKARWQVADDCVPGDGRAAGRPMTIGWPTALGSRV
jgi:hypothetical protein